MILKETLRRVAQSQSADRKNFDYGVEREHLAGLDIDIPFATVIAGIRRCGKSTLLMQMIRKAGGAHYFNFEDSRVEGFEPADFERLDSVFEEEYGRNDRYFFDEIQNVPKWELFVRPLLDRRKRVVLTGSNASLLSRELGTRLTGRHLCTELFPFSYGEMLSFSRKKPGVRSFGEYLVHGGFPEYLKHSRDGILLELLKDIVERDIVVRHGLRSSRTAKEMALYLLTNVGREFTYNSLRKTFDLGSTHSVVSLVSFFEDSYVLFTVPRFDYSLKKQLVNPKKAYSIDNGLTRVNSASFSSDRGSMLENLVFLQLRKGFRDVYYFRGKRECDFVVRDKGRMVSAIQACYELNEDNRKRELDGLTEAMDALGLKRGLVLTFDQEDELREGSRKFEVKPVWKWLLGV